MARVPHCHLRRFTVVTLIGISKEACAKLLKQVPITIAIATLLLQKEMFSTASVANCAF